MRRSADSSWLLNVLLFFLVDFSFHIKMSTEEQKMYLNSLSDDDQSEVFSRLPVEELLRFNSICRKWTAPLQQACREVTRVSILGSPRMYISSSTRGPNRILQEAYDEYGIPTLPSFYHVTLRNNNFTMETVNFLLATFPKIEHLELVQVAPDRNFDSCVQLIAGLSRTLKSLSIFHEKDHELTYWEDATKPLSLGSHSRVWAKDHLDNMATAPRRILSNISKENYPQLKHISVVDFTMYSESTPPIDSPPNLSHLESFYYIHPFDQTFIIQTLAIQEQWKNLKNLAITSNVFNFQSHLDKHCEYKAFQETLASLRRLTISGIFPDILTHFNVCSNLVHLHIHDLKLRFLDLLPKLADLKALHTLRIYFDVAIFTTNFDPAEVKAVPIYLNNALVGHKPLVIVPLPSVEILQLKNTEIIHQPLKAANVLAEYLPKLRTLILNQDSIGNRRLRDQCRHCRTVPHRVHENCKNRFIRLTFRNRRGAARFEHLESIKINSKNYQQNDQDTEWSPKWKWQYDVWNRSKDTWEVEQISF